MDSAPGEGSEAGPWDVKGPRRLEREGGSAVQKANASQWGAEALVTAEAPEGVHPGKIG